MCVAFKGQGSMYQALVGHFALFTCICRNQNSVTTKNVSCIIIKNLGNVGLQKISIPHQGGNFT